MRQTGRGCVPSIAGGFGTVQGGVRVPAMRALSSCRLAGSEPSAAGLFVPLVSPVPRPRGATIFCHTVPVDVLPEPDPVLRVDIRHHQSHRPAHHLSDLPHGGPGDHGQFPVGQCSVDGEG
jgi:hypothetical protein